MTENVPNTEVAPDILPPPEQVDERLWNVVLVTAEAVGTTPEELAIIHEVVDALGAYHPPTAEHTLRVGLGAALIARQLGEDEHMAFLAGSLHDAGKLEISLEVLGKSGKFTEDDHAVMTNHSPAGYELLQMTYGNRLPATVAKVAGMHHLYQEKNPNGLVRLPMYLEEERILQIVAIADPDDARHVRNDGGNKGRGGTLDEMTTNDIQRILYFESSENPDLAADIVDSLNYLREGYLRPTAEETRTAS